MKLIRYFNGHSIEQVFWWVIVATWLALIAVLNVSIKGWHESMAEDRAMLQAQIDLLESQIPLSKKLEEYLERR